MVEKTYVIVSLCHNCFTHQNNSNMRANSGVHSTILPKYAYMDTHTSNHHWRKRETTMEVDRSNKHWAK